MSRPALLAALSVTLLAGCSPDLDEPTIPTGIRAFPQVTGEWEYSAPQLRLAGSTGDAPCEITGVTLRIVQIPKAGAFSGRTSGGRLTCRGDLGFLSGPLTDYPIGNGYTFNEFISFDLGTPEWRHDGLVMSPDSVYPDSMSGSVKLRNGGIAFDGAFRAVRRTRAQP